MESARADYFSRTSAAFIIRPMSSKPLSGPVGWLTRIDADWGSVLFAGVIVLAALAGVLPKIPW